MLEMVALAVIAVMAGVIYAVRNQRTAERNYERLERFRKIGGAVLLVFLAATFLNSGNILLIGIALVALALAGLYIGVEKPHEDVI